MLDMYLGEFLSHTLSTSLDIACSECLVGSCIITWGAPHRLKMAA
jgi:hypothetical protein